MKKANVDDAAGISTADMIRDFTRAGMRLVRRIALNGEFVGAVTPVGKMTEERLRSASVIVRGRLDRLAASDEASLGRLKVCVPKDLVAVNRYLPGGGGGWVRTEDAPPPGGTPLAHSTAGCDWTIPRGGMHDLSKFETSIWRDTAGKIRFVASDEAAGGPFVGEDFARLSEGSVHHIAWPSGAASVLPDGRPVAVGHASGAVVEWISGGGPATAYTSDGLNIAAGHADGSTSHLILHRAPFAYGGVDLEHISSDTAASGRGSMFFDLQTERSRPEGRPESPVVGLHIRNIVVATAHPCGTVHISHRKDILNLPPASDPGWWRTIRGVTSIDTSVPEYLVINAADGTHVISCRAPDTLPLHLPPDQTLALHPYSPSNASLATFHLIFGDGWVKPLWLPSLQKFGTNARDFIDLGTGAGRPTVHLRRGGPAQRLADTVTEDGWAEFVTGRVISVGIAGGMVEKKDPGPRRLSALVPSRARAARAVSNLARLV